MDPMLQDVTLLDAGAVPAVLGFVQIARKFIPERARDILLPLVSLALGVVYWTWLREGATGDLSGSLVSGITLGLTASGMFAAGRNGMGPLGKMLGGLLGKPPAPPAPPSPAV